MDLTSISSRDLEQIAKLLKRKESLQEQIDQINQQLEYFSSDTPAPAGRKPGRPPGKRQMSAAGRARIAAAAKARWARFHAAQGGKPAPKAAAAKGGRRGHVKEQLINALKAAGKAGTTVPDLASKLGMKPQNVRAWIYTTGKTLVHPVKRGVFALKG